MTNGELILGGVAITLIAVIFWLLKFAGGMIMAMAQIPERKVDVIFSFITILFSLLGPGTILYGIFKVVASHWR